LTQIDTIATGADKLAAMAGNERGEARGIGCMQEKDEAFPSIQRKSVGSVFEEVGSEWPGVDPANRSLHQERYCDPASRNTAWGADDGEDAAREDQSSMVYEGPEVSLIGFDVRVFCSQRSGGASSMQSNGRGRSSKQDRREATGNAVNREKL